MPCGPVDEVGMLSAVQYLIWGAPLNNGCLVETRILMRQGDGLDSSQWGYYTLLAMQEGYHLALGSL